MTSDGRCGAWVDSPADVGDPRPRLTFYILTRFPKRGKREGGEELRKGGRDIYLDIEVYLEIICFHFLCPSVCVLYGS